jgi:hypothetical protein
MKGINRLSKLLLVLFAGGVICCECYSDTDGRNPPSLRVPKIKTPPLIDGKITQEEYREFASFTGLVRCKPKMVVPVMQQVIWYLGYDNEYLYLAMISPNPESSWPLANIKPEDALDFPIDRALLNDDHVEIELGVFGRKKSPMGGYGFFKLIINPRGAMTDRHWFNGTPGSEDLWNYGGETKCSVDKKQWLLETKVSLKSLRIDKPDGFSFPIQLVRADSAGDSVYFAEWAGCGWMDWTEFGEITLDPDASSVQLLEVGEIGKRLMSLKFKLNNLASDARSFNIHVKASDGSGKPIYDQEKKLELEQGKSGELSFAETLALTPLGNNVRITVSQGDRSGRSKVLYSVRLPVAELTDDLWKKDYAPWAAGRPQTGDYKWTFAYWPNHGVIRASVDVDMFGLKAEIGKADAWSLGVYPKGKEKAVSEKKEKIEKRRDSMILETGSLPAGEYEAKLTLFGEDGNRVIDEKKASFVRNNYPWEGNKLGKANLVVSPYTPIKADGLALSPWGRTYTVSNTGLIEQIKAVGGRSGEEAILRAPIILEGIKDGRVVGIENPAVEVKNATDARIDLQANGTLGGVKVNVASYLEFDGWYNVRLTLDPGNTPQSFDSLSLVMPIWERADTMYVQRGDGISQNKTDMIPDGKGIIWNSRELTSVGKEFGSFVPVAFAGNGDKGLWYFAVDARDWTLSPDKAALEYVRNESGAVDLRFNFFAARTLLDKPRTIEFALLATPVKPYPENIRHRSWYGDTKYYGHSTEGYRTYGFSVDGFEMYRDEDYSMLTEYLKKTFPLVNEGKPMVLYGSTWMCGLGLDAFDTYGGEWIGRTNWDPMPDTYYKGRKNMQGSLIFETPRQLTPLAVMNWTDSFVDCFMWWHQRLFEKCPVNGTWWDNSSIGCFMDYDPVKKEFYRKWNVFMRRNLMKRLVTMQKEMGKDPVWLMNMHSDFSWCQEAWHVENDFNSLSTEGTILDVINVDQFRALCRIKRGVVEALDSKMSFSNVPRRQFEQQARAGYGLCLLHDIGGRSLHNQGAAVHRQLLETMSKYVDFFGKAEFIPYWDRTDLAVNETPGTHLSIYRDGKRAVLVIMNTSHKDIAYPRLKISKDLIPGKRDHELKVYDAETLENWRCVDRKFMTYNERHFLFEKDGLMLMVVE